MLIPLQVLTVLIVSVAMALSLAHALELPGKMRLPREEYLAVQKIYYPGFTFGGASEPLGAIFLILVLMFVPMSRTAFWLVAVSLAALLVMQGIFWLVTQPVNKAWLRYADVGQAGRAFFALEKEMGSEEKPVDDWMALRDRWETSHVARAVFAMASLILLVVALVI